MTRLPCFAAGFWLGLGLALGLALPAEAANTDMHPRVLLDDGSPNQPPDAALGAAANPLRTYGSYSYASAGAGQFGLTVATATSLTVPAGATMAEVCVETAGVRYRDDGTAPTATVGMPVAAGGCSQFAGPLNAIQFIAQSGSPTLDILYYKAN